MRSGAKRRLLTLAAPIAILGAVYLVRNRDTGERMPDPPYGMFLSRTHNGIQYSLQQIQGDLYLWTQRTKDKEPRKVGSTRIDSRDAYGGATNNVFGDDAYWEIAQPQLPFQVGPPVGTGVAIPRNLPYLGQFLYPTSKLPHDAGERRSPFHIVPNEDLRQIDLIHSSLSRGGFDWVKVVTPLKTLDRLSRAITAKGVYWLPKLPIDGMQVVNNKGVRMETPPKYDLMFSAYGGAAPKRVLPGVYGSDLWAGKEHVFWVCPRPYPDTKVDLHTLRMSDYLHTVVPEYTSPNPPTECSGRLYWGEVAPDSEYPSRPVQIESAAADGSGRRTEFKTGSGGRYLYGFGTHKDHLYIVLSDTKDAGPGKGRATYWLAVLDPSGKSEPRVVQQLPNSYSGEPDFDEDFLYYFRPKSRDGLFDMFGPPRRFRATIQRYRVRLPD